MAPRKNPYGYDHKTYCVPQLQAILNLEDRPREFEDVKKKIRILVKKYMDPAKLSIQNANEMALIKRKLTKKYPELYGGEDSNRRLFFVEKVVLMMHCVRRKNFRESQAKRGSSNIATSTNQDSSPPTSSGPSAESSVLSPPGSPVNPSDATGESSNQSYPITEPAAPESSSVPDHEASGSTVSADSESVNTNTNNNSTLLPTPLSVVRPRPKKDLAIPFVLLPSVKSNGASKRAISYSQSSQEDTAYIRQVQSPSERSISMPEPNSSLSESAHNPTDHTRSESDITSIRQFLLACRPPMGHFLSRFINVGWKNKDFLYAMSTWSDTYRYQMLRRVVGTRDGHGNVGATEAEIAILDYHLMRYGFQVENGNADA